MIQKSENLQEFAIPRNSTNNESTSNITNMSMQKDLIKL